MNPHNIEMQDIPNVFFNIVSGVSNMRNFKSQKIMHDHCNKEKGINNVLHHSCGIESNTDGAYFQRQCLEENVWKGVVKGVDNIGVVS
jgi:hypothetical protein